MASTWLERYARRAYARSFRDFFELTSRSVAIHLHDALPGLDERNLALGCTSSVYSCEAWVGGHAPETTHDELMAAAAKLGGHEFWFTKNGDGTEPKRHFTVIVVENPVASSDDAVARHHALVRTPTVTIEVPEFVRSHPAADAVTSESLSGDDGDDGDEDEPEIEVDCHE